MKLTTAFASGDHTSGTLNEIALTSLGGDYSIKRIYSRITGNAGNCTVAIYVAESGKASLTNAERAQSEVYFNDAVAPAGDPSPELNVTGTEIPIYIGAGDSIYILHVGDVNPTTCDVSLYI